MIQVKCLDSLSVRGSNTQGDPELEDGCCYCLPKDDKYGFYQIQRNGGERRDGLSEGE